MDPLPITLPSRPPKVERAVAPPAPLDFDRFVIEVGEQLKGVRARLEQRQESDEATSWWITFNRAACLYRLAGDRVTETVTLDRSIGSFIPNSQSTWRSLDSRPSQEPEFEAVLHVVKDILKRFVQP